MAISPCPQRPLLFLPLKIFVLYPCFIRVQSVAHFTTVINRREHRGRRENAETNASLCTAIRQPCTLRQNSHRLRVAHRTAGCSRHCSRTKTKDRRTKQEITEKTEKRHSPLFSLLAPVKTLCFLSVFQPRSMLLFAIAAHQRRTYRAATAAR